MRRTQGNTGLGTALTEHSAESRRRPSDRCIAYRQWFVYDEWNKGTPCACWVKVGTGERSVPVTVRNFNNPWFFVYTKQGRVTDLYFALKFVD